MPPGFMIDDTIKCSQNPNHAVLIVGYKDDEEGGYFIVKNSYGTNFGT